MIWVNYDLLFDEHKTGLPSISPNKIFRQIKDLKDVGSQPNNLFMTSMYVPIQHPEPGLLTPKQGYSDQ